MALFIFDFDGTLSDSAGFICETMALAFKEHSVTPPADAQIRHIIGLSLEQAVDILLPPLQNKGFIDKIAQSYKNIFSQKRLCGEIKDTLFTGVTQILEKIYDSHHDAAIATGKSMRGLKAELARHGLEKYFMNLQTSDFHPSKPHPAMLYSALEETGYAPQEAFMIGDTSYDIKMAVSAGVTPIGVTWGCHHPDDLQKAGAVRIINDFSELEEYL